MIVCVFVFLQTFSGIFNEKVNDGPTLTKTESNVAALSSQSRRRRQLKVEYDEEESGKALKTERWEPPDWKKHLGFIREMRSGCDAPVDNMGAEKCYDSTAPAHVGLFVNHLLCAEVLAVHHMHASSLATGETFPGAGVPHVVQSDQRPGDGCSHAKASSSRLHCGKHTSHRRWNTGETHPPCRLLEGSAESLHELEMLPFYFLLS